MRVLCPTFVDGAVQLVPTNHYFVATMTKEPSIDDGSLLVKIQAELGEEAINNLVSYCRNIAIISLLLACISAISPLDSTFRRTTGSVFDDRRLKRHWSNSILTPSI